MDFVLLPFPPLVFSVILAGASADGPTKIKNNYQEDQIFKKVVFVQVITLEIDCAIFYTNLHELFCHFISWTNWVNSGKFMENCWISCQVMAAINLPEFTYALSFYNLKSNSKSILILI